MCFSKKLDFILSLGNQYTINFLDAKKSPYPKMPIEIVLCNPVAGGCGLVQLRHTLPIDLMYREFWYVSGVNQSMRDALADVVRNVERIVPLQAGDIVLDIGSNDSTLLRSYHKPSIVRVGFEPASNLMNKARDGVAKIINTFFNYADFRKALGDKKAKVITAIAMFYDLDDPNTFVADIAKILDADGLFIIQMNYLPTMLRDNAFDNIFHEHLEYYSLAPLEYLLEQHGLEVFDIELNGVNGGSIRAYIRHTGAHAPKSLPSAKKRLAKVRHDERRQGLQKRTVYDAFSRRVQAIKKKLTNFIDTETKKGKRVYVYGASTRGNTLLQFCQLGYPRLTAAADRNPMKWGKKIVGSWVPIISEDQARREKPDYFLILPWYFLPEFLKREHKYLQSGGKFIVPLPSIRIIGKRNIVRL
ncbi:MAG: NDP-hexose 3-C-methyltransferase TylCIII [Candidatus Magasanikbacteria bacterium GW2011_GWA2_45_39]|uniref:NDP-hexose 3-C-methyltransferase TylCIII n=1 Tax=Candidatus Magasanikbacteria bacterium GW2011_GWA2_45_39 TaxID=1619041 RepID=A0A0G1QGI9_9BACT|nr:MAG: NDP-hexose 3-C-methyltransferase TylCIII [Candidatus Magasanikbacteria bacterium GW2011_GWA2_45_39]